VPFEIFDLLLGDNGQRWQGLPIYLIKEVVLGFFLHQDNVLLAVCLFDLAGDEFGKAPPTSTLGI
jgi:hypothetical protein